MRRRTNLLHALVTSASFATVAAGVASAAPKGQPVRACAVAYSGAEEQARSGHLREARDLYLKCAKATCGDLQRRCASAAEEAGSELARVAFVVSDAAGVPVVDVLVKMDGEPLVTHLTGRALPVDPGLHEFTFGARVGDPARYVWMTRKIMVVQGQREPISVTLPKPPDLEADAESHANETDPSAQSAAEDAPPATSGADVPAHDAAPPAEAAPPAPRRGGRSALPWVVGATGVLGLGAGALLTVWGRSDNTALAQCAPDCRPSSVEHIHQLYLASDVSLAAGGVAIGLAAILFATSHPRAEGGGAAAAARPRTTAFVFDVQPTRAGAFASVGGVFQ